MKIKVEMYVMYIWDKDFKLYQVEEIHSDASIGLIELENGRRIGTYAHYLRPYYLQVGDILTLEMYRGIYQVRGIEYRPFKRNSPIEFCLSTLYTQGTIKEIRTIKLQGMENRLKNYETSSK